MRTMHMVISYLKWKGIESPADQSTRQSFARSVCLSCCRQPFHLGLPHKRILENRQLWNCLQTKFLLLWTKMVFFQVFNLLCIFSSHLNAIPASSTRAVLPLLPVKRLCEKLSQSPVPAPCTMFPTWNQTFKNVRYHLSLKTEILNSFPPIYFVLLFYVRQTENTLVSENSYQVSLWDKTCPFSCFLMFPLLGTLDLAVLFTSLHQ